MVTTLPIFQKFQCWKDDRIPVVINKEAVSIDRATFLATHTPMGSIRYERAPHQMPDASEAALLDEFVGRARDGLHTFAIIQGIPGTGKSHLIRWLKERYAADCREEGLPDVVLLIERAQGTLYGTLTQLVATGAFDDGTLREQLDRLRGATSALSTTALADTLLDQLRVATMTVELAPEDQPKSRIRNNIEKFLLDYRIREVLKQPGGPIDRIVRFLSVGGRNGRDGGEAPEFTPADFEFDSELLRALDQEGYGAVRLLAIRLDTNEGERRDLARYLTRLINEAVGRTTALSAEDLKQLFNDLRRSLRRQGRDLALFIEDITAFTGIDAGLVDVLATQHTGEGNREFCRLLSVVGITDAYFTDRFPDNMKERVDYQLTLNAGVSGHVESDLLRDPDVAAEFAARYLNAMRLTQVELETWQGAGARPEEMPNRCATCPYMSSCHASFGAVAVGSRTGADQAPIGLYPFNQVALSTMYDTLDTTRNARTPRSFLGSILRYVLQSHGPRVRLGTFPPSAREVGNDFQPPPLARTLHEQTIRAQAGRDADRIDALVRFWGDRTVYATRDVSGRILVGGLPMGVYEAFSLPLLHGEEGGSIAPLPVPAARPTRHFPDAPQSLTPQSMVVQPVVSPPPLEPSRIVGKYDAEISRWRDGAKLQSYEPLRGLLASLVREAIDWEMHGISALEVAERLGNARLALADQAGRVPKDSLLFARSPQLVGALQALDYLNEAGESPDPGTVGGHLAALSRWLRQEEARIVDYVSRPPGHAATSPSLPEVLIIDSLLLEVLRGGAKATWDTAPDLYRDLVEACVATSAATKSDWDARIVAAKGLRSNLWYDLMRGVGAARADTCRSNLLRVFNCPQGASKTVLYLDAPAALDIIRRFNRSDWSPPRLVVAEDSRESVWGDAERAYLQLQQHLEQILKDERAHVQQHLSALDLFVSTDTSEATFAAIGAFLRDLREGQHPYSLEEKPANAAKDLANRRQRLLSVITQEGKRSFLVGASAATQSLAAIQGYLAYFSDFSKLVDQKEQQFAARIVALQQEGGSVALHDEIAQTYVDVGRRLQGMLTAARDLEVVR